MGTLTDNKLQSKLTNIARAPLRAAHTRSVLEPHNAYGQEPWHLRSDSATDTCGPPRNAGLHWGEGTQVLQTGTFPALAWEFLFTAWTGTHQQAHISRPASMSIPLTSSSLAKEARLQDSPTQRSGHRLQTERPSSSPLLPAGSFHRSVPSLSPAQLLLFPNTHFCCF